MVLYGDGKGPFICFFLDQRLLLPLNRLLPRLSFPSTPTTGVHECVVSSVMKADLDLRKAFFSQIVLAGGSTLFPGYGDRLLNEIRKLAPRDVKIRISAPPERKYSTWIGG